MASVDPKVATYTEFAEVVLPRIKRALGGDRGSLENGWALELGPGDLEFSRKTGLEWMGFGFKGLKKGLFIGFKVSL